MTYADTQMENEMAKKKEVKKVSKNPNVNVLEGQNGQYWVEKKLPTLHWDSEKPHGFVIIQQEDDDTGDKSFALYEGIYSDWYTGTNPPKIAEFATLEKATNFIP